MKRKHIYGKLSLKIKDLSNLSARSASVIQGGSDTCGGQPTDVCTVDSCRETCPTDSICNDHCATNSCGGTCPSADSACDSYCVCVETHNPADTRCTGECTDLSNCCAATGYESDCTCWPNC